MAAAARAIFAEEKSMSQAPSNRPGTGRTQPKRANSWMRFWIEVLVAMLVFNLIAAFVTWKWIFPRLYH